MTDLVTELREAADWVNHQLDPAPDYEELLTRAANELETAQVKIKRVEDLIVWWFEWYADSTAAIRRVRRVLGC